ncbi:MAG: 47 kDa outer membrane protein precursor [Hyphomicrobiales bacterium]|nr:47 kDa outer membrane protein precursor [Hyphomicrobiales bacterium]
MFSSRGLLLATVAAAALSAGVVEAQAGGFALREQSAVGVGNAFAGAAAGGSGLSSMFWNPATMTDFAGIQSSSSFSLILPYSNITPGAGTSPTLLFLGGSASTGDIAQDAVLPASYFSYQLGERVWAGIAVNSPFGLVTQNPNAWAAQLYGRTSKVFSVNVNPNVAVQVNDWLSVGAGLQIMYFKVRLTSANDSGATGGIPNVLLPSARSGELKGDDTAVGYTLGATVKPWSGAEIGIGYRSRVEPKLSGSFVAPGGVPSTGLAAGSYSITSGVTLPDQVTIGIRQQVTSDFTVLAGWEWTHWGLFSRFPVVTSSGAAATTLNFDYRDSWYASLGGEYAWNQNLTVRAGLAFEKSPIKNDTRSVRLPDSDRIWTTVGATYKLDQKLSFDVAYAHLFAKSGSINVVPGNPNYVAGLPFVGTTKGHVDIISVGFTYRWDDPKPNRNLVVAKY